MCHAADMSCVVVVVCIHSVRDLRAQKLKVIQHEAEGAKAPRKRPSEHYCPITLLGIVLHSFSLLFYHPAAGLPFPVLSGYQHMTLAMLHILRS